MQHEAKVLPSLCSAPTVTEARAGKQGVVCNSPTGEKQRLEARMARATAQTTYRKRGSHELEA